MAERSIKRLVGRREIIAYAVIATVLLITAFIVGQVDWSKVTVTVEIFTLIVGSVLTAFSMIIGFFFGAKTAKPET